MTGCAIVAIPDEYSPVWDISSEKIPHLTMLYLGELADDVDQAQMTLFIQHVVSTSLKPFGLSVDHRGTLGDEDADVLFFEKNRHGAYSMLESMRSYLLTDSQILKSYNAAFQYPEWTPHLTLGYPTAPAKKIDHYRDQLDYIFFNKIAIWFGDFEGPEFQLTHRDDMHEQGELAMADPVDDVLEHFGVKGMKWGKRKADPVPQGETRVIQTTPGTKLKTAGGQGLEAHSDAVRAAAAKQKARASTTDSLSDKDLKDLVNRMNMEQQYAELTNKAALRNQSTAQKFISSLVGDAVTQNVRNVVNSQVKSAFDNAVSKKATTEYTPRREYDQQFADARRAAR